MIEFGPAGWYGVISDQISFENMSIVAQAAADLLYEEHRGRPCVVLGYDTRFLSKEYAWQIQRVLTGNGIKVFMHKGPIPTFLLSYAVILHKAVLGIMVTGGGRPARYSGLKFRNSYGLPVSEQWLSELFNYLYRRYPRGNEENPELLVFVDSCEAYRCLLNNHIDFELIKRANPLILADSFYGSVGGLFSGLLRKHKISCLGIREKPNPGFGDSLPQPNSKNLNTLGRILKEKAGTAGFFFNGDGSQLGVIVQGGYVMDFSLFSAMVFDEWLALKGGIDTVFTGSVTPERAFRMIESHKIHGMDFSEISRSGYIDKEWIHWNDFSMAFGPIFPDFDAVIQALLFLSGLCRYELDLDSWIKKINAITGRRYINQKMMTIKELQWRQLYDSLLMQGKLPFGDDALEKIEEHGAIKLFLKNTSWIVLDYQSNEGVLSITVDSYSMDVLDDLMTQTIKWIFRS